MEEPTWYISKSGYRARLITGTLIVAAVERLGPHEWAWDVFGVPNAAGRAKDLNSAMYQAQVEFKIAMDKRT